MNNIKFIIPQNYTSRLANSNSLETIDFSNRISTSNFHNTEIVITDINQNKFSILNEQFKDKEILIILKLTDLKKENFEKTVYFPIKFTIISCVNKLDIEIDYKKGITLCKRLYEFTEIPIINEFISCSIYFLSLKVPEFGIYDSFTILQPEPINDNLETIIKLIKNVENNVPVKLTSIQNLLKSDSRFADLINGKAEKEFIDEKFEKETVIKLIQHGKI